MKIKKPDTAKSLIEQKLKEMDQEDIPAQEMYYVCTDTGLTFDTHGEAAEFSPFTGGRNIEPIQGVGEANEVQASQTVDTPIPGNQTDPFTQNPLSPDPTGEISFDWSTVQTSDNPAPDQQSLIGDVEADSNGYLTIKPAAMPSFQTMRPNQKDGQ